MEFVWKVSEYQDDGTWKHVGWIKAESARDAFRDAREEWHVPLCMEPRDFEWFCQETRRRMNLPAPT